METFETIVCADCLRKADCAGQLECYSECGRDEITCPETCEQCNGFLIDGEIYRAQFSL